MSGRLISARSRAQGLIELGELAVHTHLVHVEINLRETLQDAGSMDRLLQGAAFGVCTGKMTCTSGRA